MRIGTPSAFVELRITEILPPDSPAAGDLRIEFSASIAGFSGSGSAWIEVDKFKSFAIALRRLYLHFEGEAELASMSPGEMSLSLSRANARGYVGVRFAGAKLRSLSRDRDVWVRGSMSGAFEVDLGDIADIAAWSETPQVEAPN